MRLPDALPSVVRLADGAGLAVPRPAEGLRLQGCNIFEWAGCAAAIAGCTALSGPALVACVALVAPGCVKCVS